VLWVFLILYIFCILAVLCEEYFVPSIEVIGYNWNLSDDEMGATLMAAGSSSTQLFTAILGALLYPDDNPGPGTNLGSAVFNIGMILGVSAMVSPRRVLELEIKPLIRDVLFYFLTMGWMWILYEVISPGKVALWEACVLVSLCILYYIVIFNFGRILRMLGMEDPREKDIEAATDGQSPSISNVSPSATVGQFWGSNFKRQTSDGARIEKTKSFTTRGTRPFMFARQPSTTPAGHELARNTSDPRDIQEAHRVSRNAKAITKKYALVKHLHRADSAPDVSHEQIAKDPEIVPVDDDGAPSPKVGAAPPRVQVNTSRLNNEETEDTEAAGWTEQPKSALSTLAHEDRVTSRAAGKKHERSFLGHLWHWTVVVPWDFYVFRHTIPAPGEEILPDHADAEPHHGPRSPCTSTWGCFWMALFWIGVLSYILVDICAKFSSCIGMSLELTGITLLVVGNSVPDALSSIFIAQKEKGDTAVANVFGSSIFDIGLCIGTGYILQSATEGGDEIDFDAGRYNLLIILVFLPLLVFLALVLGFNGGVTSLRYWHGPILIFLYLAYTTFAVIDLEYIMK